jgi:hypothetical protein
MVPYFQWDVGISVPAHHVFHNTDVFVAPPGQREIVV